MEPTVPCPVRVLARTLTLRRGRHVGHLPIRCPRGCDAEWELRHARRVTATLGPDTNVPDHPRAEQQAPIRVVVRLAR